MVYNFLFHRGFEEAHRGVGMRGDGETMSLPRDSVAWLAGGDAAFVFSRADGDDRC